MCTEAEREALGRAFNRYYEKRAVDPEDLPALERLYNASYVDMWMEGGVLMARVTDVCRRWYAPAHGRRGRFGLPRAAILRKRVRSIG